MTCAVGRMAAPISAPGRACRHEHRPSVPLRLNNVTFCQKCSHWVKVTAAGLCACGAILTASPSAGAAPTTVAPAHHLGYVPWYPSDSESFHPAEPDPTLDGSATEYIGTVPVSARINTVSIFALDYGGAIEIDHLTGPVNLKYIRAPRPGRTE
jgi:hypothetical protein